MTADIDTRVSIIENRTAGIENNIADIKLTLENEIRANIERAAEGHFDLSRDLKDAIKTRACLKNAFCEMCFTLGTQRA